MDLLACSDHSCVVSFRPLPPINFPGYLSTHLQTCFPHPSYTYLPSYHNTCCCCTIFNCFFCIVSYCISLYEELGLAGTYCKNLRIASTLYESSHTESPTTVPTDIPTSDVLISLLNIYASLYYLSLLMSHYSSLTKDELV